eukprot:TRINITY_DN2941_c0_g1_i8.p2 TRINITY_DN2941_c0_g1~~TRINITY_DN2941_c0_g1_i8.p2  ORF type:complete len:185 (+),score=45.47 TRINITY_DN2941_c0_g1_i8:1181-1735(+)
MQPRQYASATTMPTSFRVSSSSGSLPSSKYAEARGRIRPSTQTSAASSTVSSRASSTTPSPATGVTSILSPPVPRTQVASTTNKRKGAPGITPPTPTVSLSDVPSAPPNMAELQEDAAVKADYKSLVRFVATSSIFLVAYKHAHQWLPGDLTQPMSESILVHNRSGERVFGELDWRLKLSSLPS